ncbi:MAG: AAA family ATPase, partial [Solirubrobacteraceae bacterium]
MHLKSLTLKGFKSFPDRTRLEFAPGVSVVVGPNGSGKSNVTDAVLWALGEQRPLAVRGQTMQDIIFGGGRGVQARNAAEVELVLDNSDGTVDLPVGEISVVRRLDRSGDGEYRLNGARCRLTDVQEVLSDTGLGKEAHSVVSQGRVEAIVTSKPKDRRLLIEEAAGLGKHRKRRRRAQLKLERTRENLDQALLVEQEARKQLGPLKRQAEAAELHARLERQTVEARWELVRDALRDRRARLAAADVETTAAKAERDELQTELDGVVAERRQAEEALAQQAQHRDRLASRARRATASAERIELRRERVDDRRQSLADRIAQRAGQLEELAEQARADAPDDAGTDRITTLETELEALDRERQSNLERELEVLSAAVVTAEAKLVEATAEAERVAAEAAEAESAAQQVRARRREREQAAEQARRSAAAVGAQLAAANQFLRSHAGGVGTGPKGSRTVSLADGLRVDDGCELAVAAALDGRLGAALADDLPAGRELLRGGGRDGARVLLPDATSTSPPDDDAPVDGATALAPRVHGDAPAIDVARRLLAGTWLVDELPDAVPLTFTGTLVTPEGHVWRVGTGELQRTPQGGAERVLAERNRRDRLIEESDAAVRAEHDAIAAVEGLKDEIAAADAARDTGEQRVREARRVQSDAQESVREATRGVTRRRAAPDDGPTAVRRAQILGELQAERRTAERLARERAERERRVGGLRRALEADRAVLPVGEQVAALLGEAVRTVRARAEALQRAVDEDRASGDDVAGRLQIGRA